MLSSLMVVLLVASLVHLFFFAYNRYLLCLTDSPWKRPIHIAWAFVSIPLPVALLAAFHRAPWVQQALSWSPESAAASALFITMIAVIASFGTRLLLWIQDRVVPEVPGNLLEETVSKPTVPPVPSTLPRLLRPLDVTGELQLVERELAVPGLAPAFDGFTIAHVADIHFGQRLEMENYLEGVRELVNQLNADLIVFTGDFVDRRRDIVRAVEYHAGFRARLGSLCVMGNHDYWTRPDRLLECLGRTPIKWLGAGERRILKRHGRRLIFTGTDAPWDGNRRDWRRSVRRETGDALVVLSHTPDNAPVAARLGASLILSGHNHGGQICLPLFGPVVVPSSYGLRFSGGCYRVGAESILNVSRGVGVSSGGLRINCPPEICLLTLRAPVVDVMVGKVIDARDLLTPVEDKEATGGVLAN